MSCRVMSCHVHQTDYATRHTTLDTHYRAQLAQLREEMEHTMHTVLTGVMRDDDDDKTFITATQTRTNTVTTAPTWTRHDLTRARELILSYGHAGRKREEMVSRVMMEWGGTARVAAMRCDAILHIK